MAIDEEEKMYHYKDWPPVKTINHIRGILESLGIMPIENNWVNNKNQMYSVRLIVDGTTVGTNGKGITAEWALASAFGEFMERIQNQSLYPLFTYYECDTSLQDLNGFRCYPDEVYLSVPELLKRTDKTILVNLIPQNLEEHESPDKYIQALSVLTFNLGIKKLPCLPYYCINTDTLVYLPRTILSYVYGSNGMCAGNTPEEALIQGLCEIVERYTNRTVLLNGLTPPEIPREYFSHLSQADLLETLEENEILTVIVKDASLGKRLPAVCVSVINREHNKYFVKFASHVEFEVALERTLTELFQGRTIEQLEKGDIMVPFEYLLDETYKSDENLFTVFKIGGGIYNNDFFSSVPSYPLNGEYHKTKDLKNNQEYLRHLIQMLLKEGWQILVRDVSFLGFPAFHIIIPGISELSGICKEDCIEVEKKVKVAGLLKNIKKCTKEELLEVVEVVEDQMKKEERGNIADLTGLPYLKGFPWEEISFNLFLCTLYLRIGDFKKSHFHMKKYLSNIEEMNSELQPDGLTYYKCVRDYLAILTEKEAHKEKEIGILQQIYGDKIVSEVLETIYPERALQYYTRLPCPDCNQCPFRSGCSYEKIQAIHAKIKNAAADNGIDQLSKNREFWSNYVD